MKIADIMSGFIELLKYKTALGGELQAILRIAQLYYFV